MIPRNLARVRNAPTCSGRCWCSLDLKIIWQIWQREFVPDYLPDYVPGFVFFAARVRSVPPGSRFLPAGTCFQAGRHILL